MVARKTTGSAKVSTSGRSTAKKSAGLSGTSIVRNTRTSTSATTTPSYSPVIMPRRRSCEKEKIGLQRISAVSPVVATKISDEEYKISLNFEALKDVIEGFEELDLCGVNVKLCNVSGDTVFSWEVSFDKFHANEAEIATLSVTDTASINELEVSGESTFNGEATFKAPVNMEDVLNTTDINNSGKITTDDFESNTATINDTLTAHTISAEEGEFENLSVSDTATINNAVITNETVENSTITNLEATDAHITNDLKVDWETELNTLNVNWESTFKDKVRILDELYVSGDTIFNSEVKFNWPEVHNNTVTFNDDVIIHWELQVDDIDVDLSDYQKREEKGMSNGYASLDNTGKVPFSQLPNITGWVHYKGGWDASTGVYPANPSAWDMYYTSVAGTIGTTTYSVGDRIIYDADNAVWLQLPDNYGVQSVNGRTGIVVDVQDITDRKNAIDLTNPATNKYLSEKAVADIINSLIDRIEELEEQKPSFISLDLPASMTKETDYIVVAQDITATTHILVLDTQTVGNVVITPGAWYVTIRSSADETNPEVNILAVKWE